MPTFKYPPTAANGKLMLSSDADATKEAILQAVQTKYGERVFRASYGNDIDEFTVINDLQGTLDALKDSIDYSTLEYRPLFLGITGDINDQGRVNAQIDFDDDQRLQTINTVV